MPPNQTDAEIIAIPARWTALPGTDVEVYLKGKYHGDERGSIKLYRGPMRSGRLRGWILNPPTAFYARIIPRHVVG